MRTLTTLLAAGLVLSSTVAFAASKNDSQKQAEQSKMAMTSTPTSEPKYCIDQSPDEATGSRIYTHECRTKAEWAKRGVDVDAEQKRQ